MDQNRKLLLIGLGILVVGIGLGVIIGYFSNSGNSPSWVDTVKLQLRDIDEDTVPSYVDRIQAKNIRDELMFLAEKPHMATTPQDELLVNYINDKWSEYLDESEIVTYDIMLSFPSDEVGKENVASVLADNGTEIFRTRTSEIVYNEFMKDAANIVPYYNAFAPAGTVEGQLVYANFGSREDFAYLAAQGVDLNGTIALTKYGRVGRGTRTIYAKEYGVAGVLVYSDPENYVVDGEIGYPTDFSLPGTGVQRGSTMSEFGDPTTPLFPSIDSAYRTPVAEITYFPVLPLQPIAYADAENLIQRMTNTINPEGSWSTELNGNDLRIGPGFTDGGSLKLSVNNERRYVKSSNVIGKIRGSTEPDNWIMYGNHRDSWVYGAVDPSSGTACMLEMTRAFGEMLKSGWRPKRTILFGSWGAEESGLIGSTEWAQENAQLLSERSVTYINVDIAVFGNATFNAGASTAMKGVLMKAAEMVGDPVNKGKTVLDTWISYKPGDTVNEPRINGLGSGSDYAYFYHALGITSADLSYRGDPSQQRYQISPYPTYHTAYDTFDYVDRFVDPGFIAHSTVCKVAGTAVLLLADSLIIPIDPREVATRVKTQAHSTGDLYTDVLTAKFIGYLMNAANDLAASASDLMTYVDEELDRENVAKVAAVNDRLRLFEKSFIEPAALPGEINYKHISGSTISSGQSFSSIDLFLNKESPTADDRKSAKQQLAMITYRILNAANLLKIDK